MNKGTILKLFTMKEILESNPDYVFSPMGNLVIKDDRVVCGLFEFLGTELRASKEHKWPSWAIERDLGW